MIFPASRATRLSLSLHALLQPATALLGRLRYAHKFLLIGAIILTPLAVALSLADERLSQEIEAIGKRRVGVMYGSAVRVLLQSLQQQRGLVVASRSGDSGFQAQLTQKQQAVAAAARGLAQIDARHGAVLGTNQAWASVRARIGGLAGGVWEMTPESSLGRHSAAIEELLGLLEQAIRESGLELDPGLERHRLQESLYRRLPRLTETLGELRARGTAATAVGTQTDQERTRITLLYGASKALADEAFAELESTMTVGTSRLEKLRAQVRAAHESVDRFLDITERGLVRAGAVPASADPYFQAATLTIDEQFALFDAASPLLDEMLAEQETELVRDRNRFRGLGVAGLLLVFWLFAAFSLNATGNLVRLCAAAKRIRVNDFGICPPVGDRDELGELVMAFNEMSARLRAQIADLAAGAAELARQNSLIDAQSRGVSLVSTSTAALLSATRIDDFAARALDLLGRLPGAPEHLLFCVEDDAQGMAFAVAGSGRFASMTATPLADLTDATLRSCLKPGPAGGVPAAGRLLCRIVTGSGDTVLIYGEEAPGVGDVVDDSVRAAYCNQIATTYSHVIQLRRIRQAHSTAILALAQLAEYKDNETGDHVMRVAQMTDEISAVLHLRGLFPEQIHGAFLEQVGTASVLHDVGKVAVPDSILLKPGKLDAAEWQVMKTHTLAGAAILSQAASMSRESLYFSIAIQVAESHHEQFDGSGYPHGLRGEEIPLAARIVAVVDVFDALASKRPYKEPWPMHDIITYIGERGGKQFDPRVVDAFFAVMEHRAHPDRAEWTPELSVGDAELDADHHRLINMIGHLELVSTVSNQSFAAYFLEDISRFMHEHFTREEQHMETLGYPKIAGHRHRHEELSRRFATIEWAHERGLHPDPGKGLLDFLTVWVTYHIREDDRDYYRFALDLAS